MAGISEVSTWVTIGLSSGVVSAVFTALFNHWRESRAQRRGTKYSALRLATILEAYAIHCANLVVAIHGQWAKKGDSPPGFSGLPEFPPYPDSLDLKSIPEDIASGILAFPNDVMMANAAVSDIWLFEPEGGTLEECYHRAGQCGLRALGLAGRLRKHYKLPEFALNMAGWDICEILAKPEREVGEEVANYLEKNPIPPAPPLPAPAVPSARS